jgi:superfamily I DNA and RNA helicase
MVKWQQKEPKLEISFCQKSKWEKDWTHFWFCFRTSGMTSTADDKKKTTRYPLASIMTSTWVTPGSEVGAHRAACNKAFAMA